MIFSDVTLKPAPETETSSYVLALYASGFERRSRFIAETRRPSSESTKVLVFNEDRETLSSPENLVFFRQNFATNELVKTAASSSYEILEALNLIVAKSSPDRDLCLFVDYSAMTRTWYGSILSFFRHLDWKANVVIDFAYAHGTYDDATFRPRAVTDIVAQQGFAGLCSGMRDTVAIFGLGFDKYATLAVFDRIEPDLAYYFLARSSSKSITDARVRNENAELIAMMTGGELLLPLEDVGETFRLLCERVAFLDRSKQVVLVPMGPKPHVLASLLVSFRLPHVACLHARGVRVPEVQVTADGTTSVCRVTFVPEKTKESAEPCN